MALKSDGTVLAWGNSISGQLGNGYYSNSYTVFPQRVVGLDVPTGWVAIDSNALSTASQSVNLTFGAVDDCSDVTRMRISNHRIFDTGSWQPYAPTLAWNLDPGDGLKTVCVQFMDAAGNLSDTIRTRILVASTMPHIYATTPKSLAGAIMNSASNRWLFRTWGKVTIIDGNSFTLSDGSGMSIKVVSPGYTGLITGSFATVTGILDPTVTPRILTCPVENISAVY